MSKAIIVAARCAIADLIGLELEGVLSDEAKSTIVELYQALIDEGEDMADYRESVDNILEDLGDDVN